ncbi:MAG: hypothetical protein HFH68_04225 [Lachnospiraceae bacterium]|nr:hypothetical protein [Lachnospiraceae bacterium]
MDIKELKDFLATSCETNRYKYVPWWEDDFNNCTYRYNIFKEEEIKDIEECINGCGSEVYSMPVGSMKMPLFHILVCLGFYDIVEGILGNPDIDIVNIAGSNGITPLMIACSRGNLKMTEALLKHGADVSVCDTEGRNVYHYLACPYIRGLAPVYECQRKGVSQIQAIARLLPEGTEKEYINKKDIYGLAPFVHMLKSNNKNSSWALTDIFMEKGADTGYIDEKGNTLLMAAIYNHHMTAALRLIEAGTGINQKNNEGKSPLNLAHDYYNEALCMALKEHGADGECEFCNMDMNNLERITSNAFAMVSEDEMDNKSIALYLAKKLIDRVDVDDDDDIKCISGIFYSALSGGRGIEVLDILKDSGVDFTVPVHSGGSVTCLRDECLHGNYGTKVINKLIDFGIDMDEPLVKGRTPACIVASLQKRKMFYGGKDDYCEKAAVFFSKDSMEYTDNSGTTAIHQAARNNHWEMLEVMAGKGADVNITEDSPAEAGNTPLHTACIYGSAEAVKVLKKHGADDSQQNVNGETPAHFAVMKKKFGDDLKTEERAALLRELECLDAVRNDGKTPLMLLQYMDINTNLDLLPLFLEKGADVNKKDNYGNTALILNAQNHCYKGVVKELVRAGADVNATDKTGKNVLHYVLEYGNQEAARFLIKKGADYNQPDNRGVTPAQLIAEKGYDTLLELLEGV